MRTKLALLLPVAAGLLLPASILPAQISRNMTLESHIPLPPCTSLDVWAVGNYMFLARVIQGFAVIDVSDPKNPIMKTIRPPGYPVPSGTLGCSDIKSDGRYLFVTDEALGEGAFIYDLQPDPMNPTLVATLRNGGPTPVFAHNLWIDGNYLYAQEKIFDISDRLNPTLVAVLQTPGPYVGDTVVFDGRAYVANWLFGLLIFDVTNPATPVLLGRGFFPGLTTHNVWPSEDRNYVYTTDENMIAGYGGHVRIWDVSNLPTVTQVGVFKTGPTSSVVHNVHVWGELLFIAYFKEGLRICSLKDPVNPVEIAYYDTYLPLGDGCHHFTAGCWGVYPWNGDYMLVGDIDSGVYILRFHPVGQTLDVRYQRASRPHQPSEYVEVDFSMKNDTPAGLDSFGLVFLSGINGRPVSIPMISILDTMEPFQSVRRTLRLPPIADLFSGTTLEFTGYTGTRRPLTLSEQKKVTVRIE